MRIIQATDYGSPFPGSFVPMLHAALEEADFRGWDMQVVLPDRARERDWLDRLSDFESHLVFSPPVSRRQLRDWLFELTAQASGPAVLHSHFTVFDYAVAGVARLRPDVRAFWHVHTVLSERARVRLANRYKLAVAARPVERILCVAPHLANAVIARGAPREKVLYFPNGLEAGSYAPATPEQRAAARVGIGLPEDATVLLHFGRSWLAKGGDIFLEAVRSLRERGRDVVALCARGGESAKDLAAELGISEAVFPRERLYTHNMYAASDILVSSSRGEGMPLTVLEALASGLPVAASDIPGHHIPDADLPALAIVPLDPERVADGVEAFLDADEETLDRNTTRSCEWVKSNMDVHPWAARLMDLYAASRLER